MKALGKGNRSLEEVVEELLNDESLKNIKDPIIRARVQIQRLKGEMRKYLSRPKMFAAHIAYIKDKIREIEEQFPEATDIYYRKVE